MANDVTQNTTMVGINIVHQLVHYSPYNFIIAVQIILLWSQLSPTKSFHYCYDFIIANDSALKCLLSHM